MDTTRLRALSRVSRHFIVAESEGPIAAFLLAMPEGGDDPNENFVWFAARAETFVYVDCV